MSGLVLSLVVLVATSSTCCNFKLSVSSVCTATPPAATSSLLDAPIASPTTFSNCSNTAVFEFGSETNSLRSRNASHNLGIKPAVQTIKPMGKGALSAAALLLVAAADGVVISARPPIIVQAGAACVRGIILNLLVTSKFSAAAQQSAGAASL